MTSFGLARQFSRLVMAVLLFAVPSLHAIAAPLVTILEGEAHLIRQTQRLKLVEGVALQAGDVLETSANAFLQIELDDGGAFQLGPRTNCLYTGEPAGPYLLQGWIKQVAASAQLRGYRGPSFELNAGGIALARIAEGETQVFVEAGEGKLAERPAAGTMTLKAGDFYARKNGGKAQVAKRVDPAFVGEMPPAFRDSVPARRDAFKGKNVVPKPAPDFVYADVQHWLKAEPAIRRAMVQRWRSKAADPAFRQALIANLAAHPEWEPVLYPPKPSESKVRQGADQAKPWWASPPAPQSGQGAPAQ